MAFGYIVPFDLRCAAIRGSVGVPKCAQPFFWLAVFVSCGSVRYSLHLGKKGHVLAYVRVYTGMHGNNINTAPLQRRVYASKGREKAQTPVVPFVRIYYSDPVRCGCIRDPSQAGYVGLLHICLYSFAVFISDRFLCCVFPLYYSMPSCTKRGRYDFIVVLGAGLCGKRVTPLLARRLDKALTYYDKGGRQARLVVSGGQGADEEVPEAAAMRDYLKEKGVKREMILMEDRSVNTFENMKYSKRIMDAHKEDYRCLFVTNDFHVVRSGMHARRVGLGNARGAGCRTAAYYWPSAFIREYLAMLARYQWEAAAYAVMCFPITALFLL